MENGVEIMTAMVGACLYVENVGMKVVDQATRPCVGGPMKSNTQSPTNNQLAKHHLQAENDWNQKYR
nr:hypothetical protein Itr_chr03CG24650 [Ipomoea trifida]